MRSSSLCWTKRITYVHSSFSLLSLFVVAVFVLTFDDGDRISRTSLTVRTAAATSQLYSLFIICNLINFLLQFICI